jgi:hypothetical protein
MRTKINNIEDRSGRAAYVEVLFLCFLTAFVIIPTTVLMGHWPVLTLQIPKKFRRTSLNVSND